MKPSSLIFQKMKKYSENLFLTPVYSRIGFKTDKKMIYPLIYEKINHNVYSGALKLLYQYYPEFYRLIVEEIHDFYWASEISMMSASCLMQSEGLIILVLDDTLKKAFNDLKGDFNLILYLLFVHEAKEVEIVTKYNVNSDINSEIASFLKKAEAYYCLYTYDRLAILNGVRKIDNYNGEYHTRFLSVFDFLSEYNHITILEQINMKNILNFITQDFRLNINDFNNQIMREYYEG